MKSTSILLMVLQIVVLCHGTAIAAVSDENKELVQRVLKEERKDWNKSPWQEHAEALKPLGDSAIQALETFLTDPNLR